MDGGSRADDWDRCFSRTGRRRGGRGVLERAPVAGPAGPARASGTALPGPLAVRAQGGNRRQGGRRDFLSRLLSRTPRCHEHTEKSTRARPLPARPMYWLRGQDSNLRHGG